jgi:hypothetical protein
MKRALNLLVFLVPALLQAAKGEKWYEAYDRGVAAVRGGNHAVAAQALQAAINEQPNENAAARGRNDAFVYVPHFWLGIAKFNLGDDEGALKEFKQSEDQGVVQNTRYYSDLREWLSRVQAARQKATDNIAAEGRRIAGAASKTAVSAQMEAVSVGGDRNDSYRAGQRKLQEARDVAAKAGSDLKEYRRAADIATQARDLFVAAAEESKKQKAARPAPVQQKPVVAQATPAPVVEKPKEAQVAQAQVVPTAIAPPVAEMPVPKPAEPAPLSAAAADARVAVQQYRRKLASASSNPRGDARFREWTRTAAREAEKWEGVVAGTLTDSAAKTITSQVSDRERELGLRVADLAHVAEDAAPLEAENIQPALERAWRVYASGDLGRADELLTQILAARPSAEAFLLRACSRYTQASLAKKGDALLAGANSDFRSALRLNPALRLDQRNFSPKLVAYFDGVRSGK